MFHLRVALLRYLYDLRLFWKEPWHALARGTVKGSVLPVATFKLSQLV